MLYFFKYIINWLFRASVVWFNIPYNQPTLYREQFLKENNEKVLKIRINCRVKIFEIAHNLDNVHLSFTY